MRIIFYILFATCIISCKQQKNIAPKAIIDTVMVLKQITALDTLIKNTNSNDTLQITSLTTKMNLSRSIGKWDAWAQAILKLADIKYEHTAYRPWVHTMLDSVIALKKLKSTDTAINIAIAKAGYMQFLKYGKAQQYTQQAKYGELFVNDSSTQYLDKTKYEVYTNYVKPVTGEAYLRIGDNAKAIAILENHLWASYKTNNPETITTATYSLCNAFNKSGLSPRALPVEKKAIDYSNLSSDATKANYYLVYAETLVNTNDTLQAMQYYNKAILLVKETDLYTYAQTMASLASLLHGQKNYYNAIAAYKKSIDSYTSFGSDFIRENSKNYNAISECFLDAKNLDSAWEYNNKALELYNIKTKPIDYQKAILQLSNENAIMDAFDMRCNILKAQFEIKNDIKYLEEIVAATKISFSVQWLLLSSFEFTSSLDAENELAKNRSQQVLDACYSLLQITGNNKWAATAFEMAEKSKAVVLQQTLKRQLITNNIANDELVIKENEIEQNLAALADTNNSINKDSAAAATTALTTKLLSVQTQLNAKYPNLKEALKQEDKTNIALITKQLIKKNSILIEYFVGNATNYVFAISNNGIVLMEPLQNNTVVIANNWQQYFTNKNTILNNFKAFNKDAFATYQQLLPKSIREKITNSSIKSMVLITDGTLGYIPFDALLTAVPNTATVTNTAPYLVKSVAITNGYSAQSLLLRNHRSNQINTAIFAPVFEQQQRGLAPLKNSAAEAAIAQQAFPNSVGYLKQQATLNSFTKALPSLSLIHLATHASAGENTTPQIEFFDSSLSLNRIYTLPVNANLVVLSACQTGIGKLAVGEGPLSLARGFYYAGARQVITSLWNVDDKSNGEIFKNFYAQKWQTATSKALQKAKVNYIKNNDEIKASPYYWAGTTIFGIDAKSTTNYWWYVAISTAILLLLFIVNKTLLISKKKQKA
jgi:CHAT domain-containing protein